jgi:hypothetical protein
MKQEAPSSKIIRFLGRGSSLKTLKPEFGFYAASKVKARKLGRE